MFLNLLEGLRFTLRLKKPCKGWLKLDWQVWYKIRKIEKSLQIKSFSYSIMVSFQASWPKIIPLYMYNITNPKEHEFQLPKPLHKAQKTVIQSEVAERFWGQFKLFQGSNKLYRSSLKLSQYSQASKVFRVRRTPSRFSLVF